MIDTLNPRASRLAWAGLALAALAGMAAVAAIEPVTLSAAIEVADYDDDGNVASVMIFVAEHGSILIDNEGKGKELLDHVGEWATITGTLEALDGEGGYDYVIQVEDFTLEDAIGH